MVLLPVFSTASDCRTLLLLQCWQENAAKAPLSTPEELRQHWFQCMTLLHYVTSTEKKCKLCVKCDDCGPPCLNTEFYTSFPSYYKHNTHCHVNLKPYITLNTILWNATFVSFLKKVIIMISRNTHKKNGLFIKFRK